MALVSNAGSGNTWLRGVIERLSGYFTGSAYTSKKLFVTGKISLSICKMKLTSTETTSASSTQFTGKGNIFSVFHFEMVHKMDAMKTEWRTFVVLETKRWQNTTLDPQNRTWRYSTLR